MCVSDMAVLPTVLLTVLAAVPLALGAPSADLITYLPGLLKQPSFNQYSGYLQATGTNMLHYWYTLSTHSPTKDPLILWLGDGPGCSTMNSVLSGNGPFTLQPDGVNLDYSDNSWNKFANVLYIESPAGVGYSYSSDVTATFDDNTVTADHLAALQDFYKKYPEAVALPLYVLGEGYAGVYAPLLAKSIYETSNITSLKGFGVGNAMTSESFLSNSLIFFAYYRGIIGEDLWTSLQNSCCSGTKCEFYNTTVPACSAAVDKALYNVDSIGLNPYNILADCAGGAPSPGGDVHQDGYLHYGTSPSDVFRHSGYNQMRQKSLEKRPSHKMKQELSCLDFSNVTTYLNNPYVREALHIDAARPDWQMCNATVQQNYVKLYPDMKAIYIQLQETYLYRFLVYNGDLDAMYNAIGNEWFVDDLGLEEEVQWRTWLYDDGSLQIAGFVKEYDHVAYVTVKGAGHMTAADKPISTYQLIYNFIHDRPY